eukprot:TRINITY_DN18000_c0_g1_i1.p4 TRINITY_DN18000_c0_g1~~TRINITY_DN18000_c0_g1_i1.p4  ORF type:complete len:128 (+),score=1.71 TRINITY_DN18000_c0_g1_i1:594-977(+)
MIDNTPNADKVRTIPPILPIIHSLPVEKAIACAMRPTNKTAPIMYSAYSGTKSRKSEIPIKNNDKGTYSQKFAWALILLSIPWSPPAPKDIDFMPRSLITLNDNIIRIKPKIPENKDVTYRPAILNK